MITGQTHLRCLRMVMRGLARRLTERSVERPVVEGTDGEKIGEKTGNGRRWTARRSARGSVERPGPGTGIIITGDLRRLRRGTAEYQQSLQAFYALYVPKMLFAFFGKLSENSSITA